MRPPDVLDAVQGYYLGRILLYFRQQDIFRCFHQPVDPREIAARRGYDAALFAALVEFVRQRTTILTRDCDGLYSIGEGFRSFYSLEFQIDKFLGAYGPAVDNLGETLVNEELGRGLVNRSIEAAAYAEIRSPPNPLVIEEVARREIRTLVDLGCGPGTLLKALAESDYAFQGWGVDTDGAMLAAARDAFVGDSLGDRIQLIEADARRLSSALPTRALAQAQAVHCKGLFDELFRTGDAACIEFLSELRALFPKRILFNVDYYGKLTRLDDVPARYQHTLLHDLLQQLTAQGTPPADLAHWMGLYDAAGCSVLHVYESESSGVDWFVHVVEL